MQYERHTLLKDLKENVCEVFLKPDNGGKSVAIRCSLKPEVLPDSYLITEESKIAEFHQKNENLIAAWKMSGGWIQFNINAVTYVQVVDTF